MKTNALGKHKKPHARIFSACVLFSFVLTQNAMHPAFAFLAAPPVDSISVDSEKIQPEFNQITKNWSNHSLASVLSPVRPVSEDLASVVWTRSGYASSSIKPVSVSLYIDASGKKVKRFKFKNSYAEVYAGNDFRWDGRIKVINRETNRGREILDFAYDKISQNETVKISTGNAYQIFLIRANGEIGALLETGRVESGKAIRERVYDSANSVVTIYNPANVYEKRTYELKLNHEPGRLLFYRDRNSAGAVMGVRFLYDPREGSVTCVYLRDMSFAVYGFRNQRLGNLMRIGTAKFITQSGSLVARNVIGVSKLVRNGKSIPVYTFSDSEKNSYVVRERSLAGSEGLGPIGRVLRYSGEEGDFEYFYEESPQSEVSSVTVLNYGTGKFLKFEISKNDLRQTSGDLLPAGRPDGGESLKAVAPHTKIVTYARALFLAAPQESDVLNVENLGNWLREVRSVSERGPPSQDNSAFFTRFYSPASRLFSYFSSLSKSVLFFEEAFSLETTQKSIPGGVAL